jgi:hypothetical protein
MLVDAVQEELSRLNGLVPLMQLLHRSTKAQLLEYVASALLKVCCTHILHRCYEPHTRTHAAAGLNRKEKLQCSTRTHAQHGTRMGSDVSV